LYLVGDTSGFGAANKTLISYDIGNYREDGVITIYGK